MRARWKCAWRIAVSVLELVRPDLRGFEGYASARQTQVAGDVWLNANESPVASAIDRSRSLHRYPEPQPRLLRERMAAHYGVAPEQLMVTRGSDEGIDLLVRALCRCGLDAVAVAPPCFGLYAVSARVQGARLQAVPLLETAQGFAWDFAGLRAAVDAGARLLFLCSPANPTGQSLPREELLALADFARGRAVLVVDEAYADYSAGPGAISLLGRFPELVVLRTLSKAHALAGARIGALLGAPPLVRLLRNLSAPYPIAAPSAGLALRALAPSVLERTARRIRATLRERERLAPRLAEAAGVRRVHASDANVLLARFEDAAAASRRLLDAGIVVREMSSMPGLGDALRITVGTRRENEALLRALGRPA
jgi:histidinol-phosphate aminotransferase